MDYLQRRAIENLIALCWPKLLFPAARHVFKSNSGFVSCDEICHAKNEPVGGCIDPWGFIRVKDEKTTLKASLNRIRKAVSKGVICYNGCTDGSDEIIRQFCSENPTFIPFEYPYEVIPAMDSRLLGENVKFENTLAGYYNAVLELIPKDEWLIKLDCDHMYFPELLKRSFALPRNEDEWVSYSRLNVIRDAAGVVKVIDYTRPHDHWLIFNRDLVFENIPGKYEVLRSKRKFSKNRWSPECSNIHFPFEKKYRSKPANLDADKLVALEEFAKSAPKGHFDETFFNMNRINGFIAEFDES